EQRAPDLQHEVVVVLEAQREDAVETGDGAAPLTKLEQHLAQPRQGVFVLGVEPHRFLERPTRPEILLAGEPRVAQADVQVGAAAAHAGLTPDGAPDVALLVSATGCATAGVFTKNALRAAPVTYDADLLVERPGRIRAVAMNARVANACTGAPGLAAARAMAHAAEQAAGLPARTALVLSTGVIGVPLPLDQITSA